MRKLLATALLLGSSSAFALPITHDHEINASPTGSTVGYSGFQVTSEGFFHLRANRFRRNGPFVNPSLYLFTGVLGHSSQSWNLIDQSSAQLPYTPTRPNSGLNAHINNIFLTLGSYIIAVSDLGFPESGFTEEEARNGHNDDVATLGNSFGTIRVLIREGADRRNDNGGYSPAAHTVPEPGLLALLGIGSIAGLAVHRRRQRHAA